MRICALKAALDINLEEAFKCACTHKHPPIYPHACTHKFPYNVFFSYVAMLLFPYSCITMCCLENNKLPDILLCTNHSFLLLLFIFVKWDTAPAHLSSIFCQRSLKQSGEGPTGLSRREKSSAKSRYTLPPITLGKALKW